MVCTFIGWRSCSIRLERAPKECPAAGGSFKAALYFFFRSRGARALTPSLVERPVSGPVERGCSLAARAEAAGRACECPTCKGRVKLVALVTEPRNIARFLSALRDSADE
jgi:hypothetical protein